MDRDEVLSRLHERIVAFAAGGGDAAREFAEQVVSETEAQHDPAEPPDELVPLALRTLLARMPVPNGDAAGAELLERLAAAVPRLDERCREILRLKLLGRSFEEIQEELEAGSVDTVYDQDLKCRRKLMGSQSGTVGGLVGGYAAGNLTPDERRRLFGAALDDGEVFEALAVEEPLRELLEDGAARARLVEATGRREFNIRSLFLEWLDRPRSRILVAAGLVALAGIGVRSVWDRNAAIEYVVLRADGKSLQAVPSGYLFRPEDRIGFRIRLKQEGALEVRDDAGNLLYAGRPAAEEVVTILAEMPFGRAAQRSFDLRTRDVSVKITLKGKE